MELTSPVGSCWVALGMKTEPTHRPRDGHLLARPLSVGSLPCHPARQHRPRRGASPGPTGHPQLSRPQRRPLFIGSGGCCSSPTNDSPSPAGNASKSDCVSAIPPARSAPPTCPDNSCARSMPPAPRSWPSAGWPGSTVTAAAATCRAYPGWPKWAAPARPSLRLRRPWRSSRPRPSAVPKRWRPAVGILHGTLGDLYEAEDHLSGIRRRKTMILRSLERSSPAGCAFWPLVRCRLLARLTASRSTPSPPSGQPS